MTSLPTLLLTLTILSPSGFVRTPEKTPEGSIRSPASAAARESIIMRWSTLDSEPDEDLAAWHRLNSRQLTRVETAWAALLRRMSGFRPALFDRQCLALVASLEQLDEALLLPVPDRLVDLYVKRLLNHLHGAARACRADELFNVVYRLEEARSALAEVRWLLAQRRVGPSRPSRPPRLRR